MDGVDVAVSARRLIEREAERIDRALGAVSEPALQSTFPRLGEAVRYALATRGKRLRPILCCAAYRAVSGGEPGPQVYRFACAVEIVHTYSLVHDDLPCMDDDDVRRGRPTVHRVYGTTLATLAGAALIPLAVRVLDTESAALGLDARQRGRLIAELCEAAGARGMVGGQLLDLEAEDRPVDGEMLERIHRAKTGALLATSLRLGALAAHGGEEQLQALTAYGEAIGLAFQIADDVLDVTAKSEALGKTAGRDASLRKATYPSLFGVDGARALAREWVARARSALRDAGIHSPELDMLAGYVVERGR